MLCSGDMSAPNAPILVSPKLTAQHASRRIHPEGVIPLGILCYILSLRQSVF